MKRNGLKLIVILVGAVFVALGVYRFVQNREGDENAIRISIVYTQPYPVLKDAISSFKEVIRAAYPDASFTERHANGRPEEYGTVVLAAINDRPNLIVPLTTPITSLAVTQARGAIPVVFIAVTDPVGAHVVNSLDNPVLSTGSSDLCPYSSLLSTVRNVLPNVRTLGLPYNPSDQPAVFGRTQLLSLAPQYGFSIVDEQFTAASELGTVTRGLASRSDAIVISSDNLMMENATLAASAAAEQGKPTFACDSASVRSGALAGVAVDYGEVGRLAGERALQVLRGENPGGIPVGVLNSGGLAINKRVACVLHVDVDPALYTRATEIVERDYVCNR